MWKLQEDFQVFNLGDANCKHDFVFRANMEPFSDNKNTKVHYKVCTKCGKLEKKFETPIPTKDFDGMYEKFYKTTVSDNLAGVFGKGEEEAFSIDIVSNDDRVLGNRCLLKFSMIYETRESTQKPFDLKMLNEKTGLYEKVPFNPDAVFWFGPSGGFPLATRKYFFKIKFNTNGVYRYNIDLVRLEDQFVIASDKEEINVATVKI